MCPYTANVLNQYTQRTVPGIFDVAGAAGSGATVTVNGSSSGVTRHGEYFFKPQSLSNNPNAVFSSLSISDGTTTTSLAAFLAGTPEPMSYDYDGNMLSDGRWDYTYDGENRMISITTHTALSPSTIANVDARKLEFKYDYYGRRVQKTVRGGYNGSSYTSVLADIKFLYDGSNLLFEANAAAGLAWIRAYVRGSDLSGTLQGAGGVGGLINCYDFASGKTLLPAYDAMGNIHGMIDQSNGALVASYEYDGFGTNVRQSGTFAAVNPFRFSTKYTDDETSLVDFGRRFYSPSQGRFIGRDPVEEKGGLHLYAFCLNNSVNAYDYLGMDAFMVISDTCYTPWGHIWEQGDGMDGLDYLNAGIAKGNSAANGMWLSGALAQADAQTAEVSARMAWDLVSVTAASGAQQQAANWLGVTVSGGLNEAGGIHISGNGFSINGGGLTSLEPTSAAASVDGPSSSSPRIVTSTPLPATSHLPISVGFEAGASITPNTLHALANIQAQVDAHSGMNQVPSVTIKMNFELDPVAHPAGNIWNSTTVNALTSPSGDVRFVVASSPLQPMTRDNVVYPVLGYSQHDGRVAVLASNMNLNTPTHELGHLLGYRSNGSTHARPADNYNIMFWVAPNSGGYLDSIYYQNLRSASNPGP